jgi:hypothetical protein
LHAGQHIWGHPQHLNQVLLRSLVILLLYRVLLVLQYQHFPLVLQLRSIFFTCRTICILHFIIINEEISLICIFKELFIQRFESLWCFLILLHGSGILQLCAITFSFAAVVNIKFGKDLCLRTS